MRDGNTVPSGIASLATSFRLPMRDGNLFSGNRDSRSYAVLDYL